MTPYESYSIAVSVIVFSLFVALFSILIGSIVYLNLRLIKNGVEDDKIEREFSRKETPFYRVMSIIGKAINAVVSVGVLVICTFVFAIALYTRENPDKAAKSDVPMLKVVMSESMSEKHVLNKYLYDNELDDQLNVYDLLVIRALPEESELELYDIVVYEIDDELIIHRIVGIEEPNDKHSERYFLLQGDALAIHDKFPVKYEQMRGIYRGERVEFIGSFFVFMRSPGGYLSLFLVFVASIIAPALELLIKKAKSKRYNG